MIDRFFNLFIAYLELGIEFLSSYLMTIEGIIALMFGLFLMGLISKIKSH
jgi:hypothetical protein